MTSLSSPLGRISPRAMQRLVVTGLWSLAAITVGVLAAIIAYVLIKGLPYVTWEFVSVGPSRGGAEGGIFPMIVSTVYVTILAVIIAAPVGVGTAIYLTEYTREGRLTSIIRFGADCLAGIPSIIYGLFGFVFFVIKLKMGYSILAGALTLSLMVLPTIIRTAEEALRAVPASYRDVAFGLGCTRWQMVTRVVLRSALPGVATGIVLSIGRCVSETAAVMLTAGSALRMPQSVLDPGRTLSLHFYTLATEAISMPKAFATAAILILSILAINLFAYWLMRRFIAKVK